MSEVLLFDTVKVLSLYI